jgi:dienelactone hydrolase
MPESPITLTGREITFVFSGAPASLHMKITGQAEPARLSVYLPPNYTPSRTYPLLVLLDGAEGSLGTDTHFGRGVVGDADFIIANLPSYKENVPPLDNDAANRWQRMFISRDDAPHIWGAYGPLLDQLFTEFPNIDRNRTVFGGFSNGANTASALLSNRATATAFLERFRHFVLVEGGLQLEPTVRMEGCSAIVLQGGLRTTGGLEAMAERLRHAGADVTHGVMPGVEHYFSGEGKKQVATWLQSLARLSAPSSPDSSR